MEFKVSALLSIVFVADRILAVEVERVGVKNALNSNTMQLWDIYAIWWAVVAKEVWATLFYCDLALS